jgi:hypothetical protein
MGLNCHIINVDDWFQMHHERISKEKKRMWNFTVMAVMVVDSADYNTTDEAAVVQPQQSVSTLTANDINIFSK